jgi:hypothetical protein
MTIFNFNCLCARYVRPQLTTSQSLKIEGQINIIIDILSSLLVLRLGLKPKQIEPFVKQHQFNDSSVKKQNRKQKQTNAPLGPRHWQCTEQFGQLHLASDFICNYLLINLFDNSVKKNTSTLRPNFDAF